MRIKLDTGEILGAALLLILFIGAGILSDQYSDLLNDLVSVGGVYGMIAYVGITIIAIVIAPISTFPLLPIAVTAWGSVIGAVLSVIGWTIGGVLSYLLAFYVGRPIVSKFASLRKVQDIGSTLTGRNPFWTVVLLRMVVPVDILSYALGLFAPLPLYSYTLATFIGVMPFAFVFAYAASLPIFYQVFVIIMAGIVAMLGYRRLRNTYASRQNSTHTST